MTFQPRVLDPRPVMSLAAYSDAGGGEALTAARAVEAVAVLDTLDASGLRGRGGAGFPTGRKWRTVLENRSAAIPTTVVVNAAEGEPGSFKDRAILSRNPYRVLEGALIAAAVVRADRVVVALKSSSVDQIARVRAAADEIDAAGWSDGVSVGVLEGPSEYLFGEETALLEVLEGRLPFPRIAPPFRQGADAVGDDPGTTAGTQFGGVSSTTAPPALVNNVETLANVPGIVLHGADWFRSVGTPDSPGTVVCTVSGTTRHDGVREVPMGTPLREVIHGAGDGVAGAGISIILAGVSNPLLPASALDTAAVSYEGMEAVGAGLGTAGFLVFSEETDPVAVAQGVAHFLAIESCGQCLPCKGDGLAIAEALDRLCRSEIGDHDTVVADRLRTVADGARCSLASQQQLVVGSLLEAFPEHFRRHAAGELDAVEPVFIAPIVDLPGDAFVLDTAQRDKQPDWSFDETDSGSSPAARFDQQSGEAAEDLGQ